MSRKVSFIAVTTAAVALAAFVTLDMTFNDVFTSSLSTDVADMLADLWGSAAPYAFRVGALAVIYFLVAIIGGVLGVFAYKILRRILTSLAG